MLPDNFFYCGEMQILIILESASAGDLSADMVVVCLRLRIDDGFSLSGDGENIVDFVLIGLSFIFKVAFLDHACKVFIIMDDLLVIFFLVSVSDKTSRVEVLEAPRSYLLSLLFFLTVLSCLFYETSRKVSLLPHIDRQSGLPELSYLTFSWCMITIDEAMNRSVMAESD